LQPPPRPRLQQGYLSSAFTTHKKSPRNSQQSTATSKIAWIGVFSGILFMSRGLMAQDKKI